MSYKGKYQPTNPQKYRGDHSNIIYRSLWERKFMKYCDLNENILEWGSEEIALAYRSPIDDKIHRYYPDFYIKVKENSGEIKKCIIEIKPKKQSLIESRVANARDRAVVAINHAKWASAKAYCAQHKFTFRVITEDDLFRNGSRK